MEGYKLHLNSCSEERGKGIAIYYPVENCEVKQIVKDKTLQCSILFLPDLDVITMYRSKHCMIGLQQITSIINPNKATVICGDLNICYKTNKSHPFVQSLLHLGFVQMVSEATHIDGGHIDHVYFRARNNQVNIETILYSPYYTAKDHDAVFAVITQKSYKQLDELNCNKE